jgi:hypothetical protein
MKEESKNSYSLYNIILVGSFSSIGACLLILLFFYLLISTHSGHHLQSIPTNNDFLIASIWCLASYFLAAVSAVLSKRILQKYIPSWLIISFCGSLIFTFSFWTISHINSVRNYQPDLPFSTPPQQVSQMIWSALIVSCFFFIFAGLSSFAAFHTFPKREKEITLHLN